MTLSEQIKEIKDKAYDGVYLRVKVTDQNGNEIKIDNCDDFDTWNKSVLSHKVTYDYDFMEEFHEITIQ